MAVRKKQVPDLEEYRAMAYYRLSKDDKNEDRGRDRDGEITENILNKINLVPE